jgi:hypothetical protein
MKVGIDALTVRPGIGSGFVYPTELVRALARRDDPIDYVVFAARDNVRLFEDMGSGPKFNVISCRVSSGSVVQRSAYRHGLLSALNGKTWTYVPSPILDH